MSHAGGHVAASGTSTQLNAQLVHEIKKKAVERGMDACKVEKANVSEVIKNVERMALRELECYLKMICLRISENG